MLPRAKEWIQHLAGNTGQLSFQQAEAGVDRHLGIRKCCRITMVRLGAERLDQTMVSDGSFLREVHSLFIEIFFRGFEPFFL